MGGKFSNLFGKKPKVDENEERLQRYQEELDAGGNFIGDEADKQKLQWWQHLLYDKRMRITYVFLLGCLLGLVVPIIIFTTKLETRSRPIYGSCLIKNIARFECLPNSPEPVTEANCTKALCCWENNDNLPFKCYHSFPSAYQYNVSKTTIKNPPENGSKTKQTAIGTWTELEVRASHPDMMSPLRILTHWETKEHFVVEIFNAEVFPDRHNPTIVSSTTRQEDENEELPFDISWGEDETLFFIRIGRANTNETIFDTRLGPVYSSKKDITLATLLPTQYFYGLKGGHGLTSTLTYPILNGFESAEYPFYISFEASGQWHGVLIDTFQPMVAQVVQAPGLMFHMESTKPEMNLHFFVGPTQPQVLTQLHTYIRAKNQIDHPPFIPSYWGLGMHLCRQLDDGSLVLEHIYHNLPPNNTESSLVYDSDCIDEYFRHPLSINLEQFPENVTDAILDALQIPNYSKRVLLSQKSTVSTLLNDDQNYFKDRLVLDTSSASSVKPFKGQVGNISVNYVDYFTSRLNEPYPPVPLNYNGDPLTHHGFTLDDNFPKLDNSTFYCSPPKTRLQSYFTNNLQTSSNNFMNTSFIWGSLCPDTTAHILPEGRQSHMSLHNIYGHQALETVYKTVKERQEPGNDMLLSSGSYWTGSLYYGAFHGIPAPFTWKGLQESVENTVRNYGLVPVAGTHICGALLGSNVTFAKNNELCLRWFQFGLLLPFARNSYDEKSSFGPPHLPGQFLNHLNETIRNRYTLAPYYYTQLKKYQTTYVPMIRPMSFDFHEPQDRNGTLPKLDQFMAGDALLAAPIIDRGVSRNVYFPVGVWYSMNGMIAGNVDDARQDKPITGHLTETPLFIRGGYMIPTLQNPEGHNIEDSLRGNYTLLTALSSEAILPRTAKGTLTVKAHNSDQDHHVDFSASVTKDSLNLVTVYITINATCVTTTSLREDTDPSTISTKIDQIRLLGLGFLGAVKITVSDGSTNVSSGDFTYFGENDALRIYNLNMDWCKAQEYEVIIKQKGDEDAGGESTTIEDLPSTSEVPSTPEVSTTNEMPSTTTDE